MNTNNKETGNFGEKIAAHFLESKNLQIISRNFFSRYGEIDIIAIDKDELVFVEVKTRASSIEAALSSISRSKQQKLYKTAGIFLETHKKYDEWFTRFDVIVVINPNNERERVIKHLENAFSST